MVWGAVTIGHEHDTHETFQRTREFALRHRFALADFNVLMPYPGTPLYRQLEAEHRLLYGGKWWLDEDFRFGKAAFIPHNLSPDELADGCFMARQRYYGLVSILRRAIDPGVNMRSWSNLKMYALSNYLSYNDALKKQDIMLGGGSSP
jgi:radical SAM superfamily enzyme YgiQ (UPF0313 family)